MSLIKIHLDSINKINCNIFNISLNYKSDIEN